MKVKPLTDFSRLCVHTITTKPWPLEVILDKYPEAGVRGISVWRNLLEGKNPEKVGDAIRKSGLVPVSLVRGGFFAGKTKKARLSAVSDNFRAIDEAAAIGAPHVVLVCGAVPGLSILESIDQIRVGISAVLPYAERHGVKLAIEPLHPMYADTRSAITTLKTANGIADEFDSRYLGVAVDVFHVWWDSELKTEIRRCGRNGRLFAFHISDWKLNMSDILNDRGVMGEGVIDVRGIRGMVEKTGFKGFNEVEIFSNKWWSEDQDKFLKTIKKAYLEKS